MAFLGLGLYLAGEGVEDPAAWEGSLDVQRYSTKVIDAWAEVVSGSAGQEEIAAATQAARAQFTPDL